MNTLLEDFWYGNLSPQEQSTNDSSEIKALIPLIDRNRDKLCSTMTEEQKALLEKYDDCVNEMHRIIERELFIYAFRLGGRMMLEMLTNENYF